MKVAVLSFAHERAATYARLLHGMPGVELIIADPDGAPGDPARGRAVAAELDAPYAEGWDEVFALSPEAVVVTSEADRRRDLVERAARAGAHVLVEQPMAAEEADARAMVRACEDAGVRLTLASPACFSPAFTAVREGIAAGEALGTLTTMHGSYNTPATGGAQDGGALGANAAVLLDLVDAVLGGEPAQQVYAQANSVLGGRPGVESAALVSVRYAGGAVASIDCSRILTAAPSAGSPVGGPAMTFIGEKASVEFNARPRLLGGFDAATGGERWEAGGADLDAVMLGAFVAAAAGRGQAAGPDGAAGLRTLRIIGAAYESVHTGQPVDLAGS
ncbi:Gfo/Idh/MocA family protein [Streptomyces sp. IBSNAI002]|uniref:Gfo/Idh/MocA family protein n=1 Tax=Streptomyces sp. IBSNAI002 TaxID=3457500 RepID=UPI003FD38C9C